MRGRLCWFLFGRIGGKVVAQGPFASEQLGLAAGANISDWDSNDWECKSYNTANLQAAKSMWRAEQAEKTSQLGPTLLPIRNTETASRWKQKKSEQAQRLDELKEERGL